MTDGRRCGQAETRAGKPLFWGGWQGAMMPVLKGFGDK